MTNFERKKKNGALDVFGGHHTRKLAGIFGDIGSYTGRPVRGCSNLARKISAIDWGAHPGSAARGFERSPFRNVLASVDRGADCGESPLLLVGRISPPLQV